MKKILVLLFLFLGSAYCQYQIKSYVFGSGGGHINNSSYQISSTIGQVFIGQSQNNEYRLAVGFWNTAFVVTSIDETPQVVPLEYSLMQNFPNPFNSQTTIRFTLKDKTQVQLAIFDLFGHNVATLVNKELPPGDYKVSVDMSNFPSGVYFYYIKSDNFSQTKKMLLLK